METAALRRMTVKQLRRRHVELFGEENRSANRQYLFRRIAWRLEAMDEGGLSERARQRAHELARDTDLRRRTRFNTRALRIPNTGIRPPQFLARWSSPPPQRR